MLLIPVAQAAAANCINMKPILDEVTARYRLPRRPH